MSGEYELDEEYDYSEDESERIEEQPRTKATTELSDGTYALLDRAEVEGAMKAKARAARVRCS